MIRYPKQSLRESLAQAADSLIAQSADNHFLRLVVTAQQRELVIARNAAEVVERKNASLLAEPKRGVCWGSVLIAAIVLLPGGFVLGMLARGLA